MTTIHSLEAAATRVKTQPMPYDAKAVANFLLDYADERRVPITQLSLQKIIYFCHGWHLALWSEPLVKDPCEAWTHGPVFPALHRAFKDAGHEPIKSRATRMNFRTGESETVDYDFELELAKLLRNVFDVYSKYRAGELRNLTHIAGGPWDQVWTEAKVKPILGMRISNESIRAFFVSHPQGLALQ